MYRKSNIYYEALIRETSTFQLYCGIFFFPDGKQDLKN